MTAKHKKDSNSENLKISWEQVSPEDAGIRIQRAFEMLLSEDISLPDSRQIDRQQH